MKHNWSRGMELPICIVCGLSHIATHLWGDDDWKQYAIKECPGLKLPHEDYQALYTREPPIALVEKIRELAKKHEAWLETVWPKRMREVGREKGKGKGERKGMRKVKVVEANTFSFDEIVTDEIDCPQYRRYGADDWDNLIGISWEPVSAWSDSKTKELEAAYQELLRGDSPSYWFSERVREWILQDDISVLTAIPRRLAAEGRQQEKAEYDALRAVAVAALEVRVSGEMTYVGGDGDEVWPEWKVLGEKLSALGKEEAGAD